MSRSRRHVLLAAAASVAALAGGVLLPAAASAQPAATPVTPNISLALSPTTVDYGHQSVTASGIVSAPTGPVVGATVTVSYLDVDRQSAQISLTTDTNGGYSGTIADPETKAQQVTATVAATSSTTAASSAPAQLGFTQDAVTITASFAQSSVNAGSTDTLSGVASYVSGGSPHPLANSLLSISFTESGDFTYSFSATVTTASDGSFSYVTPKIGLAIDSAEITVNSAATPYLEAGQLNITVPVNQAAQFDGFAGTVTADRVLRFVACAGLPEPLADSPLTGPVDYQYSGSPDGPWMTFGTGKPGDDISHCSLGVAGDLSYTGKFRAPLANAYYRAFAPAVPGQMSAVSQVIHLWKYATKITGFAVTPRSVSRNGKVTVSGRLWRLLAGKRTPEARQRIAIEFRYKNKTYTLSHRLITDSAGRFRGTFAVPRTAAWLALYKGGGNDFATASKPVVIRVR